ncbi:glycosyltransferase family 25 protein [Sedimentitalea arenosa]|uniref:Glycosyltransferase family 25 protein n=1 Tax=Sedimentitalea arenosa TaxID=2798803 RepID=A0A8J7JBK3_9RHOB|nr:glycosyltransferase family 25 protein [Arenibacterium arenosum]MBJ6372848.1 glycosyltransferase family 25 protein [Arenibacterium arenosum]
MRSMIIHMSGSSKRRGNVDRLLRDLPAAEVVEAVDGRDPEQIAGVQRSDGTLFSPHYPFALRPAEIGVFQSHRRCWQRILDAGWDFGLIAEDDLRVDPARLTRALRLIERHADREMYVRLPVKARETPARVIAEDGDIRLILPRIIGLQCICQVVGRHAAERLLAATDRIDRPVDTFLQMHWITGQPIHALLPNGNAEVAHEIGGSTIQTRTGARGKLAREAKRTLYRARLHLHPQRA